MLATKTVDLGLKDVSSFNIITQKDEHSPIQSNGTAMDLWCIVGSLKQD